MRRPAKEPSKTDSGSPDVQSSASHVVSEGEDNVSGEEELMLDALPDVTPSKKRKKGKAASKLEDLSGVDDGNERLYQERLESWTYRRSTARKRARGVDGDDDEDDDRSEWLKPHPSECDMEFQNGLASLHHSDMLTKPAIIVCPATLMKQCQ